MGRFRVSCFLWLLLAFPAFSQAPPPMTVLTYHNDNYRTGWQQHEASLNSTNVNSAKFGILHQVTLPDQVDAQPLVVSGLTLNGGKDIVIVADSTNRITYVDGASGTIILQKQFGAPVPMPIHCTNNGPFVGITGTPVIDWPSKTMFAIAYVAGPPIAYYLHALDLETLADKVAPVLVTASHNLDNGTAYTFNATVERQRPGLLLLNGAVYAGFGSFCDASASKSRGWVLGWKWNPSTPSISPIAGNELTNKDVFCPSSFPCSPKNYFLASVWMSGYGLSSDGTNVTFATGNATSGTWDGVNSIQESVVSLSSDLNTVTGLFSPVATTFTPDTATLDNRDEDLGSGGVLTLPPLGTHLLAMISGKDGRLFLLDRANHLAMLQLTPGGGCWCGPSYITDASGIGHIITSGGVRVQSWKVWLSPPSLILEGTTIIVSGQDGGFFTSVSCNFGTGGCAAGSEVIWAVSRPRDGLVPPDTSVNLYAFSSIPVSGHLPVIYGPVRAGSWPVQLSNANIVPVVSNGRVYVASSKQLTIFGLLGGTTAAQPMPAAPAMETPSGSIPRPKGKF